jgi:hypothetical protein
VIIDEMKLPVLGREEDAADTFAALTMLEIGTSFSQRVLMDASEGWLLTGQRDQQTGMEPLYYGEHNLSEQRAYQIVCLMVGSDPAKFMSLADETKMPQFRQERCRKDYAKAPPNMDRPPPRRARQNKSQPEVWPTPISIATSRINRSAIVSI